MIFDNAKPPPLTAFCMKLSDPTRFLRVANSMLNTYSMKLFGDYVRGGCCIKGVAAPAGLWVWKASTKLSRS